MSAKDVSTYTDEPLELPCEDMTSNRAGRLVLHDEGMRLEVYSFDSEIQNGDAPFRVLKVGNGKYATLFDSFDAGESLFAGATFTARKLEVIPNLIVLGPRTLSEPEKVRQIRFTFVHAEEALFYKEHIRTRREAREDHGSIDVDIFDYDRLDILSVNTAELQIKFHMSVVRGGGKIDPHIRSTPTAVLEFCNGVSLKEALRYADQLLAFFEYSLGRRSRLLNVSVSQLSEDEELKSIDSRIEPERFQIRRYYSSWKPSPGEPHRGDKIFRFYNQVERDISRAAIKLWIERLDEWGSSYALASQYLNESDVFDRDRLLRLMAWFEEIPSHQTKSGITHGMIDKLAAAAKKEAIEKGFPVSPERVKQVLNELRRLPLKQRLSAAVETNRARFGDTLVPKAIEADCHIAAKLRDEAAHGHLKLGDEGFPAFERAIYAVELICCLSMTADLPVNADTMKRALHHPLMTYALNASTGIYLE